jgi:hypothetical protein
MSISKSEEIISQHKKEIDTFSSSDFFKNLKINLNDFLSQEFLFMNDLIRFSGSVLSNSPNYSFNSLCRSINRFNDFFNYLNSKLNERNIDCSKLELKSPNKEYLSYIKSLYSLDFKDQLTGLYMICNFYCTIMCRDDIPNDLKDISNCLKNNQFDQVCNDLKRDLDRTLNERGGYSKNIVSKLISLECDSWKGLSSGGNQ